MNNREAQRIILLQKEIKYKEKRLFLRTVTKRTYFAFTGKQQKDGSATREVRVAGNPAKLGEKVASMANGRFIELPVNVRRKVTEFDNENITFEMGPLSKDDEKDFWEGYEKGCNGK